MKFFLGGLVFFLSFSASAAGSCRSVLSYDVNDVETVFLTDVGSDSIPQDCTDRFIESEGRANLPRGKVVPVQMYITTSLPGAIVQRLVEGLKPELVNKLRVTFSKSTVHSSPAVILEAKIEQ